MPESGSTVRFELPVSAPDQTLRVGGEGGEGGEGGGGAGGGLGGSG